jgi:hypothetical protein
VEYYEDIPCNFCNIFYVTIQWIYYVIWCVFKIEFKIKELGVILDGRSQLSLITIAVLNKFS